MKSAHTNILVGIGLMVLGGLLLLDRLGYVEGAAFLAALAFAAVGAIFLAVFARRRDNWWAAIPGSVFLGLAAVVTAAQVTDSGGAVAAFLFLFMGAGFAAVYLREPANWWALIPCGVMLTLAVVVSVPRELQGMPVAAILFIGLAATFGLLSVVPAGTPDHPRMTWPLIPAAVLAVLGLIFAIQSVSQLIPMDFAVPAVMILAGIGLLVYAYLARHGRQRKVHGPTTG